MAKMFYTIEEAAQRLGVDETGVKEMATSGKLQQFRDGNKLMFKREEVESIAPDPQEEPVELAGSDGPIPLADSEDTDQIDLMDDANDDSTGDARSGTGISVFDSEEVKMADPMAQTQVSSETGTQEHDLALESVSSGSGLLDLTRESDDTSLGAELLEEIYPGKEGESSDGGLDQLTAAGTGAFDSGAGLASGSATGINAEGFDANAPGAAAGAAMSAAVEPSDPAGNGLSIGLLLATTGTLIVAGIVCISALFGVSSGITRTMTADSQALWMYVGIIAGVCLVFGLVGTFVGKVLLR